MVADRGGFLSHVRGGRAWGCLVLGLRSLCLDTAVGYPPLAGSSGQLGSGIVNSTVPVPIVSNSMAGVTKVWMRATALC